MEENKTGVWIQNSMNGKIIKYNPRDDMAPFNVGDVVEVENDDVYAMFKIETVEFKGNLPITETYMIKPHGKVSKKRNLGNMLHLMMLSRLKWMCIEMVE